VRLPDSRNDTVKQKRNLRQTPNRVLSRADVAELDALGLDDEPIGEGETPSYLADATALPDFVDAAPLEDMRVSWGSGTQARLSSKIVPPLTIQASTPTAEIAR
jgi:charged multivesicular body protein 5